MPTYEYKCEKCKNIFEVFQSMSAEPLQTCPDCEGQVERLISSGNGFLFKGSGFYITDYRSDKYKKDKTKAETSSSTTQKTEKKADKPKEPKVNNMT